MKNSFRHTKYKNGNSMRCGWDSGGVWGFEMGMVAEMMIRISSNADTNGGSLHH